VINIFLLDEGWPSVFIIQSSLILHFTFIICFSLIKHFFFGQELQKWKFFLLNLVPFGTVYIKLYHKIYFYIYHCIQKKEKTKKKTNIYASCCKSNLLHGLELISDYKTCCRPTYLYGLENHYFFVFVSFYKMSNFCFWIFKEF
jgi:hypothetical protein